MDESVYIVSDLQIDAVAGEKVGRIWLTIRMTIRRIHHSWARRRPSPAAGH